MYGRGVSYELLVPYRRLGPARARDRADNDLPGRLSRRGPVLCAQRLRDCQAYLEAFRQASYSTYTHFMIRRFARVWPLHVATLLLFVGDPACRAPSDIAGNLLMIQSWGFIDHATCNEPSWSISCEWLAYLAFPCFAWILLRSERRWVALGVAALGLGGLGMLTWLSRDNSLDMTFNLGVARAACSFTIGAALCRAFTNMKPRLMFDGCGIVITAAIGGLATVGAPDLLVVCLFGPLVLCIALAAGPLRVVLGSQPFVWLGEISYSLYLWHHVIINHLKDLGGEITTPAAVGLVLGLIIGIAALSRRWIEQPARTGVIVLLSGLFHRAAGLRRVGSDRRSSAKPTSPGQS